MPLARTCSEIGIDLGVVNQLATSDGELKKGKHFGSKAQKRLARAQRELATKRRDSNRRQRQVDLVVRLHLKVKNQRTSPSIPSKENRLVEIFRRRPHGYSTKLERQTTGNPRLYDARGEACRARCADSLTPPFIHPARSCSTSEAARSPELISPSM